MIGRAGQKEPRDEASKSHDKARKTSWPQRSGKGTDASRQTWGSGSQSSSLADPKHVMETGVAEQRAPVIMLFLFS